MMTASVLFRVLALGLAGILCLAPPPPARSDDDPPTPEEISAVFAAFQKAKAARFTPEAMVALYGLPKAARAVKKLVDAAQSDPSRSIPAADSAAMEATREKMNVAILEEVARITGGSVEAIDFGKQNGIRSDKDQTLFAVDGRCSDFCPGLPRWTKRGIGPPARASPCLRSFGVHSGQKSRHSPSRHCSQSCSRIPTSGRSSPTAVFRCGWRVRRTRTCSQAKKPTRWSRWGRRSRRPSRSPWWLPTEKVGISDRFKPSARFRRTWSGRFWRGRFRRATRHG
jgi:hypothetical protein